MVQFAATVEDHGIYLGGFGLLGNLSAYPGSSLGHRTFGGFSANRRNVCDGFFGSIIDNLSHYVAVADVHA
jgi:hypothetical protein